MTTIRLTLAYDGTGFRGWAAQRDPALRTVEGSLTVVLTEAMGERVKLAVAGRTDARVHARGQVASFITSSDRDPAAVRDAINGRLAPEIVALDVRRVPDAFHARFSASAREYRYRVNMGRVPDPFDAAFVWHHACDPDLGAMRSAAQHMVGDHDFTSFCRHPGPGKPTVRDLQRVAVHRRGDRLELTFRANAFLHQMVRSLAGTLVAVGEDAVAPDSIPAILRARDRARAKHLAPPHGLTLERVIYGPRQGR